MSIPRSRQVIVRLWEPYRTACNKTVLGPLELHSIIESKISTVGSQFDFLMKNSLAGKISDPL